MKENWSIKNESLISKSGKAVRVVEHTIPDSLREPFLLDVGSGRGLFIEELNSRFKIDSSDEENFLSETARGRVNSFVKCDLNKKWPFCDNCYDAITAWNVIEHIENPLHFARESFRILKSGGFLFISLPNIFNIRNRLRFLFTGEMTRYHEANSHIAVFTHRILNKVFSGFALKSRGYLGFDFPLLPRRLSRIIFKRFLKNTKLFGQTVFFVFQK